MYKEFEEIANRLFPELDETEENESALRDMFPDGPEGLEQMEDYLEDLDN